MAQIASAMGMGGGMPSPEEMQKMAEKMKGAPGSMPGLPSNFPGLPGGLPGLGGKGLGGKMPLPGLGGFPGKKK
jgi:signal recognition particle subunit SRP54